MQMMAIIFYLLCSTAQASLGGSVSTIEKDKTALRSESAVTMLEKADSDKPYSVHEIAAGATKVREYAGQNGKVFAVTWQGPTEPDLSVLLGKYFKNYKSVAVQARHRSQKRLLRSGTLVVEKSGHMRDLRGKAYDSSLLPSGVKVEDLN